MSIKIDQLFFSFDQEPILQQICLDIQKGQFVGIIGPNGGGKTTLLKLIMGFLLPKKGKIETRGKIGYVPQIHKTDRDFPITTKELILLGALSKTNFFGVYPEEVKKQADDLIAKLGLKPHENKIFGSLSGGLAQRALLARALLSDPDILILDEPTANIDAMSTATILKMLEELKGKKTILLVTHELKTMVEKVDLVLCVQGTVSAFLPKDVCEHFALGLYHTPLLGLPINHFQKENTHAGCLHQ